MKTFQTVIVGAGNISRAWLPPLQKECVEIGAIVDINLEAAKQRIAEQNLSCKASDDLAGTLRTVQPDFVVDLTTPNAHCAVTCTALRAGYPVIGEKPMANSMVEARRMVKVAEESGKLYMVSQSRRWLAPHETLRRAVKARRIGPITTANCDFYMGCHFGGFRDAMQSPLILDMAIHHFDMARMITGQDPVAVYAHEFNPTGSWYKGAVAASCIFELTDGVVFTYRGSWCAEGCHTSWNGDWRVIGSRGTILYQGDRPPTGQVVDRAKPKGFKLPMKPAVIPEAKMPYGGMHGALREMLTFLRTGKQPQTECHDNIKSLAMVFAAIESARKKRRIAIAA